MIHDRRPRIFDVTLHRVAGRAVVRVEVPDGAEPEEAGRAAVARAGDPVVVRRFDADEAAHGRGITEGTVRLVGRVAPAPERNP